MRMPKHELMTVDHPPISSRQWRGLTGDEYANGLFLRWASGEEYRIIESLIAAHQACAWEEEAEHAEEKEKARVARANAKAWRDWYPRPRPPEMATHEGDNSMKLGTVVRLPDGREGTVVFNSLIGVGIKWGGA